MAAFRVSFLLHPTYSSRGSCLHGLLRTTCVFSGCDMVLPGCAPLQACLQASLIERALEEEMQLLLDLMPNKNIAGYRGHVSVFDEATGTCHLAGAVLERATCDLFDLLV